ncbi:O-methyltransferase ZRP4-like [Panicum miliaceum]|uniref:O-methyltransferase ZRP4-like n=1 Tax=Panicum miliaceum TaxID=4540 RepID=A0A3L6RNA7_PANMI|nr:O-methyltransferase ZRP4-like [Panicum miliaceum]
MKDGRSWRRVAAGGKVTDGASASPTPSTAVVVPVTVSDLVVDTGVHPAKLLSLRRLMRMLTVSGIVAVADHQPAAPPSDDESETVYKLAPISRLLVDDDGPSSSTPRGMSAMLRLLDGGEWRHRCSDCREQS